VVLRADEVRPGTQSQQEVDALLGALPPLVPGRENENGNGHGHGHSNGTRNGHRPARPTRKAAAAPTDPSRLSTLLAVVQKVGVVLFLTGAVLTPMALNGRSVEQELLRGFAVVVMASLPGWLFLRFIVFRAGSLWTDYVLQLHRLGMDDPQNLPEPPLCSAYHRMWLDGGGPALAGSDNIYQLKFEAYYGKAAGPGSGSARGLIRDRSVFTVLVATAIFAVGWAAVLRDDSMITAVGQLELPADALSFGFLGAYSFSLQMLMRRFFQSDLKSSAYIASSVRVITVLILVFVLAQAQLLGPNDEWGCAVAFLIGFFPLLGMQLLQKVVAAGLRRWVPTLRNPYPLSDLDGLNIWYEARLLEEGIEDMQNLVTANTVDVLLHTRVPVGRLVDWMDQAHLFLLLDPCEDDRCKNRKHEDRMKLRRLGVRTATDLESAVTPSRVLCRRADSRSVRRSRQEDLDHATALRRVLDKPDQPGPSAVDGLLKTFCNMPNLVHVRHWRDVLGTEHT